MVIADKIGVMGAIKEKYMACQGMRLMWRWRPCLKAGDHLFFGNANLQAPQPLVPLLQIPTSVLPILFSVRQNGTTQQLNDPSQGFGLGGLWFVNRLTYQRRSNSKDLGSRLLREYGSFRLGPCSVKQCQINSLWLPCTRHTWVVSVVINYCE